MNNARVKRKIAFIITIMLFFLILFPNSWSYAKELTIPTPKIKLKRMKDGESMKVTIGKTKEAEGYEIYISLAYDDKYYNMYSGYEKIEKETSPIKVETLELDGKKKRSTVLTTKFYEGLSCRGTKGIPGKYTVQVRSYNKKKFGATVYSELSKGKTVVIDNEISATGYKDKYDFSKVDIGDTVYFGAYEQDNDFFNGKEILRWIVLDKTKDSILVISEYSIDALPYNIQYSKVTWRNCTLRYWLNDIFYNNAFNDNEKKLILDTVVENYDNPVNNTMGGLDTTDHLFLLSQFDLIDSNYGFSEEYKKYDINRRFAPTPYAAARGSSVGSNYYTNDGSGSSDWWLRSPGSNNDRAVYVDGTGEVDVYGTSVSTEKGIRPAMYIKIK